MRGLGDEQRGRARVVDEHGNRAAQRDRARQRSVGRIGQAQHRFDLCGQFVREQECPAAAKRQAGRGMLDTLIAPICVERAEKIGAALDVIRVAHAAVVAQRQRRLWKSAQNIPARLRRAVRDAFEQARIARGVERGEREQVALAGEFAGDVGRGHIDKPRCSLSFAIPANAGIQPLLSTP